MLGDTHAYSDRCDGRRPPWTRVPRLVHRSTRCEDSYDLIVDLDVDPGATYLLEVSSSILETTDLTTGSPTRFECTRELTAGAGTATAVTIASSNLCFGITAPQWRTTTGDPVSPGEIHESPGPAHCNWDQIQFLTVGSFFATAYVRDVDSRFDSTYYTPGGLGLGQGGQDTTDDTVGTSGTTAYAGETLAFAVLDQPPDEAVDSQYRTAGRELFWSKSGDYVFVRTEGAMERWPLISPRPLCI